jgi:DNA-binding PadR family transcriptional regulator
MSLAMTSYAVLGLLARRGAMSGYDLTAFADRSVAHFWPISRGLVYRELARLERLRLVTGTDVPQHRLPDKRIYRLTREGEQALARWLAEVPFERDRGRSPFLLMFFFGERMPPSHLRELLSEYRRTAEQEIEDLTAIVEQLEGVHRARFGYLAAQLGVRTALARAEWAREVESLAAREAWDAPDPDREG